MNGQRAVHSDNEGIAVQDKSNGQNTHGKVRTKPAAVNKAHVSGAVSDNPDSARTQATPIKQAYAGPTFHQSPAASALPLPSFYSKSVPAKPPIPIPEEPHDDDESITPPGEGTPSKRESTPLDFLFDAARQARGFPRGESPAGSIPSRSPAGRSPAPREPDSMFPFELDGGSTPGEEGTPPPQSYRDRIDSAKSTRSTSAGIRDLDENERRAKTDALKKLLYLSPGQKSPQPDPNNPFNARAAPPRQHHSGPPTPPNYNHNPGPHMQYFPNMHQGPGRDHTFNNPPARPSSHLRYHTASEPETAELSSDNAISPPRIPTGRRDVNHTAPHMQMPLHAPMSPPPGYPQYGGPPAYHHYQPRHHNPQPPMQPQQVKHSAQQLEHDLRTVLNLNATGTG